MTAPTTQDDAVDPPRGMGAAGGDRSRCGLLTRMASIGLEELGDAVLQDRVDVKYVIPGADLAPLLRCLAPWYRVLEVAGERTSPYTSLYFDTDDFALFRRHHDGRPARAKVRSRRYDATGATYFELKLKSHAGRTRKFRAPTAGLVTCIDRDAETVLDGRFAGDPALLRPKLWVTYERITLVGIDHGERVTIDRELAFAYGGRRVQLEGVVVAELKQRRLDRSSPFLSLMRGVGVRPSRLSKYCHGVSLLHPVKHNRFRPRLRHVARSGGTYVDA